MICDCCSINIGNTLDYIFVIDHHIKNSYYCYSCYSNILLDYIE